MNQQIDLLSIEQVIDGDPLTVATDATAIAPTPKIQNVVPIERPPQDLELLRDRDRLEAFFSQSPDGFFFMMLEQPIQWDDTVDKEAILDYVFAHQPITKVNAAMLAQYGATEAEFIGLTPKDFFAHDLATGRQHWRKMFEQGRIHVETYERKLDGTQMWIEGDYSCLYDSEGNIIGHFGIQRDISDRKRTEETLLQSERNLTDFVENASVAMHWVAGDGTIIWANQAELDLLGYSREEYIGHSITEFHADAAAIEDILDRLLSDRPVQEYGADLRCKDGSIRHVSIDSNSSWRDGKFVRTRCFTRDITERKQAEEDLKRFNNALSHAMEGIALLDPKGHYVWANQAYAKAIGYSPDAMVGMNWQQTVHPDDLATVQLAYQHMLRDGKVEVAARGVRQDGSIFYKQLVMVTAYESQAELTGHYCFMKDISAAKQAEADLIHSEQKFRAIFDSMFQFIGMLTPEGIVMEANRTALEMVAVDRSAVIGKPFWDTPWWNHSPRLQAQLQQAIVRAASGELVQFEAEHLWADGRRAFVDFSLKPSIDAAGKVVMLIPEGHDITERKHREEMLRNISLGVSTKTDKSLFSALAEYLTKTLGVEFAFIGELIPPEQERISTIAGYGDGRVLENFDYALAHTPCEHVVERQPCIYPHQVRQQFPLDTYLQTIEAEGFMGVPLVDSTGRVLGLISVLSRQPLGDTQLMAEILNIFAVRAAAELERQQAEIELYNQKQDLARSNDELQQFAYVASHDLQEPLRMITSYLELLERRYKGQLDPKADMFIAYAVDGAARMQTLIEDLLSYSQLGKRKREFEPVDCELILKNVLTNLQVTISQSNAQIDRDPLPKIKADPAQMTQLFQNLISNAIKFHGAEPPQIRIGVEFADDKWLFSVQDNGIGIENQYLERIFIIFQRLHSRTEYPGTGIGLAVCKKIVERHGGTLWVESQLGRGSTFHFTLPHLAGH